MEAVVLAGGLGRRLRPVVQDTQKVMAPVAGRPFLRFILDFLSDRGAGHVVLAVGYRHEDISDFFGESYRGMEITYSIEDEPLDTGGAIRKALESCREDFVFVLNGDSYFDIDLGALVRVHEATSSPFVIAAKRMEHFDRYGEIVVDGCRITEFGEKRYCASGLINAGIYYIARDFFSAVEKQKFSLEKDIFENERYNGSFAACVCEGYFVDIGIPGDYERAGDFFSKRLVKNRAVFFDRDGTINIDKNHLYRIEDFEFVEGMPSFIGLWNRWGYKVIVVTNQAGIARGLYTVDQMRTLHAYMNRQLGRYGAHVDAFYHCPHHPDFTGACNCRKPKPGMLERAIHEFDLDPQQCILFGDKDSDVLAGRRCGVFSVKTSEAVVRGNIGN